MNDELRSIEREIEAHEREEEEERQDEINMGVDEGIVVDEVQEIDTELKKKLSTYFNNK